MTDLRNRIAPPAIKHFTFAVLAVFIAIIATYHAAKPLEESSSPFGPDQAQPTLMGTVPAPNLTYAEHAMNIAAQFARVADLHDEEQKILCRALTERSCSETNVERCSAVMSRCQDLTLLRAEIVEERKAVQVIFNHGFFEFERLCGDIVANGERLTRKQAGLREAYRTTLFERFNELTDLLLLRNKALGALHAEARRIGGEAMLQNLGAAHRHEAAKAAGHRILWSLRAISRDGSGDSPPPRVQSTHDPRIPPCDDETQCLKI